MKITLKIKAEIDQEFIDLYNKIFNCTIKHWVIVNGQQHEISGTQFEYYYEFEQDFLNTKQEELLEISKEKIKGTPIKSIKLEQLYITKEL